MREPLAFMAEKNRNMKKIILLLLIIFLSNFIKGQSFIETTKKWSTVIHKLPSFTIMTEFIKFEGDTFIDLFTYKKVFRSTDEFQNNWAPYGFIRETLDEKIFYRTNISQEFLLYDFGLNINDVIETIGICGYANSENLSPIKFKVSQIDSLQFGTEIKKRFHMNPIFENDTSTIPTDYWIEGIGSTSGIFHWEALLVGGDSYELLCFKNNDSLIYQNPSYNSCYYITDLEKNNNEYFIDIYPNPVKNKLKIKIKNLDLNKIFRLEIFDIFGNKIFFKEINDNFEIDKNYLKTGILFYRVLCDEKLIKQSKIIIE